MGGGAFSRNESDGKRLLKDRERKQNRLQPTNNGSAGGLPRDAEDSPPRTVAVDTSPRVGISRFRGAGSYAAGNGASPEPEPSCHNSLLRLFTFLSIPPLLLLSFHSSLLPQLGDLYAPASGSEVFAG